jgi:hypothetical protein
VEVTSPRLPSKAAKPMSAFSFSFVISYSCSHDDRQ